MLSAGAAILDTTALQRHLAFSLNYDSAELPKAVFLLHVECLKIKVVYLFSHGSDINLMQNNYQMIIGCLRFWSFNEDAVYLQPLNSVISNTCMVTEYIFSPIMKQEIKNRR